jgi:DNA-binding NtrC family response regulator
MPAIRLDTDAKNILLSYAWPGNVRQLKNITEQISIIEREREITAHVLKNYLPDYGAVKLPAIIKRDDDKSFASERELLYKILFDMKNDMNDLKKLVFDLMRKDDFDLNLHKKNTGAVKNIFSEDGNDMHAEPEQQATVTDYQLSPSRKNIQDTEEIIEESLSLYDKEMEMINKALEKYRGKRKLAAHELGISERTLYRKIKGYGID